MKSRPCGWVFRLSRASRVIRERRLPCLRGLAGPSYESRLAVRLQGRLRRSTGQLARLPPCVLVVHRARSRHQDSRPEARARRTYRFASGEVYEGEFANDTMHGHGTYGSADGGVYEGQFEDGKQHGLGTARHANGTVHMGRYEAGKLFEGAEWSPDRKTTWGNKGGKDVGQISADEAAKIVEALGMSVPK